MKWYNKYIFDRFGHRRLMTRDEYMGQIRAELESHSLRVLEKREHELLLEIAALANIATKAIASGDRDGLDNGLDAIERLQPALMSFKIVQQNKLAEDPPSANRTREVVLMDIS